MEGTLKGKKLRFLKFLNKAETNLNYEKTDLKFEETDLKYEETDQFLSFWKKEETDLKIKYEETDLKLEKTDQQIEIFKVFVKSGTKS